MTCYVTATAALSAREARPESVASHYRRRLRSLQAYLRDPRELNPVGAYLVALCVRAMQKETA